MMLGDQGDSQLRYSTDHILGFNANCNNCVVLSLCTGQKC